MSCRKNSPGRPCCNQVCCDPLVVPDGWTQISDCCAWKVTEITEDFTDVCSDSVRTDTRSASVDYLVWTAPWPIYAETDFSAITCITNPTTGIEQCFGSNGSPLPACDETPTVCNTVTETHSITTESRLVVRYRPIRRFDTIARVQTACDGGASTCKWILISKVLYQVLAEQVDLINEDYSLTDTDTGVCCGNWNITYSSSDTCEEKLAALAGASEVTLCRAKYFTTQPTGTITFDPGDTIDCDPLDDPCTDLCSDELEICSTDPGEIPWTAPVCNDTCQSEYCFVIVTYDAGAGPPPP
jgi:hypothetical protein